MKSTQKAVAHKERSMSFIVPWVVNRRASRFRREGLSFALRMLSRMMEFQGNGEQLHCSRTTTFQRLLEWDRRDRHEAPSQRPLTVLTDHA